MTTPACASVAGLGIARSTRRLAPMSSPQRGAHVFYRHALYSTFKERLTLPAPAFRLGRRKHRLGRTGYPPECPGRLAYLSAASSPHPKAYLTTLSTGCQPLRSPSGPTPQRPFRSADPRAFPQAERDVTTLPTVCQPRRFRPRSTPDSLPVEPPAKGPSPRAERDSITLRAACQPPRCAPWSLRKRSSLERFRRGVSPKRMRTLAQHRPRVNPFAELFSRGRHGAGHPAARAARSALFQGDSPSRLRPAPTPPASSPSLPSYPEPGCPGSPHTPSPPAHQTESPSAPSPWRPGPCRPCPGSAPPRQ